jgi:hypothetical protein
MCSWQSWQLSWSPGSPSEADYVVEHETRVIRRLVRVALAVPLLAVGVGGASSFAHVGPGSPLCASAAVTHRVGVVVEHGDGRVLRRCVGFDTASATALGVLQASGLEVGIASYGGGLGAAVCQIDNEPSSYPPGCFTSSGSYWVLFVSRAGGAWVVSDLGASNVTVATGDDIGFRYDSQTGADPPPPSPAGTCPAETPRPTPAPMPSAKATPQARSASPAPGTHSQLPATPAPATTPTAGVLGLVTPGPTPITLGSLRPASGQPGVNIGLLMAAAGAGGLIGLLGVQALRRRRE